MSWLCDSNGHAFINQHRKFAPRCFTQDERAAMQIVASHVHPSNLGDLPPSPDTLLYKARQIGLL